MIPIHPCVPRRLFQRLRLRLVLGLLALAGLLAACGPGVGGTGTGVETGQDTTNGAASAPAPAAQTGLDICASVLAGALDCTMGTQAGSARVEFVVTDPGGERVRVLLEGQGLIVREACRGEVYAGQVAAVSAMGADYRGPWTTADASRLNANASLRAATDGNPLSGLQLTLRTDAGVVLAGPWELRRADASTPTLVCPN